MFVVLSSVKDESQFNPNTAIGGTWSYLGVGYIAYTDVPVYAGDIHGIKGYSIKWRNDNGVIQGNGSFYSIGLISGSGDVLTRRSFASGQDSTEIIYPANLRVFSSSASFSNIVYMWERTA